MADGYGTRGEYTAKVFISTRDLEDSVHVNGELTPGLVVIPFKIIGKVCSSSTKRSPKKLKKSTRLLAAV
jgi:hypothetical protein